MAISPVSWRGSTEGGEGEHYVSVPESAAAVLRSWSGEGHLTAWLCVSECLQTFTAQGFPVNPYHYQQQQMAALRMAQQQQMAQQQVREVRVRPVRAPGLTLSSSPGGGEDEAAEDATRTAATACQWPALPAARDSSSLSWVPPDWRRPDSQPSPLVARAPNGATTIGNSLMCIHHTYNIRVGLHYLFFCIAPTLDQLFDP